MKKQLFAAGACALALAGVTAASASADDIIGNDYATVQVFDANGLARTVDCTASRAAVECSGNANALETALGFSGPAANGHIVAYRTLNAQHQTLVEASNNDASQAAIDQFDASGAPGSDPAWAPLQPEVNAVSAAKHKAKAKKAAKHRKKAAKKG